MGALSISDLSVVEAEPRIKDIVLGEKLGFERPRDIRKIIGRRLSEIERHGVCATVAQIHSGGRGRPGREYLLNEAQALVVCMFAETVNAAEVRAQIIQVFMAWRRGQLTPPPCAGIISTTEIIPSDPIARHAARQNQLVEIMDAEQSIAGQYYIATALAQLLPSGKGKVYPRFWSDLPVRRRAITLHRQKTVDAAVAQMREDFGPDRAPSRSALARFWKALDAVRRPAW